MPLSITHYLDHMAMLTNQWTPQNYRERDRQRIYLKDIDCPSVWHDKLQEEMPPGLFYLNNSTGEVGGLGAREVPNPNGIGAKLGRGIARAGDLMSCLPPSMRAQNLMCYIGHEGTYTPAHREMCASLGQNIMVETSGPVGEDGKPTKPGSAVWFMTETKDRHIVSEYWLSALGHDIEVESHFAQINAWKRAPFNVYVVEQKVGDFILIPPLAPHQVWNRGTRTMKVAWNRTTVETLELALKEALPRARMVCRDEQYKNKAIVLFALHQYSSYLGVLENVKSRASAEVKAHFFDSPKIKQVVKEFKRLFKLFTTILVSELFHQSRHKETCEYIPYESNITCSYCRCNIFNRFLTCKSCVIPLQDGEQDTYDVCMECFVMGRSCKCRSRLQWCEQFPMKDIIEKYDIWRSQIVALQDGRADEGLFAIKIERDRYPKKTLAEICQEQLLVRPFKDITKEDTPEPTEEEEEAGANQVAKNGPMKKKPRKRPEKWYRENPKCHTCMSRHPQWRVAMCSCGTGYCFGSLWRGFDLQPQTILEDPDWKCPRCRKICTCTQCAKDPASIPYEPEGTVLGHDTRKFADPRSLEHLVDFSSSNMYWVRKAGDEWANGSRRMLRRQDEAAHAKAQDQVTELDNLDVDGQSSLQTYDDEAALPLDPQLAADFQSNNGGSIAIHTARNALSAMKGLSQLEQDPETFIAQARLEGVPPDESLDYEYPDPTPVQPKEHLGNVEMTPKSKKRKRRSDLPLVQSDAATDVNSKFQLEQAKQSMDEAKRQGRLISAKAAITGHKKLVVLRLAPAALQSVLPHVETAPTVIPAEAPQPPVLVESDLPRQIPTDVSAAQNPQVLRKRRRVEIDKDFTATRREERRSGVKRSGRKLVPETEEADKSESEHDFEEIVEEIEKTTPKRRSLPAYLARRSPVDENEMPKELTNGSARRPSRAQKTGSLRPSTTLATHSPMTEPPTVLNNDNSSPTDTGLAAAQDAALSNRSTPQDLAFESPEEPATLDSVAERSPNPESLSSRESAVPDGKAVKSSMDENRKAKLRAVGGFDETESDFSDDYIVATPRQKAGTAALRPVAPPTKVIQLSKGPRRFSDSSESLDTSESSASEDVIQPAPKNVVASTVHTPMIAPAKRGRGRPPKSAGKSAGRMSNGFVESPPKQSIFSKFGPGKVRISSRKRS